MAGVFFSLGYANKSIAQDHLINQPQYSWLRLAEEQYRQGHYAMAAQSAEKYLLLDSKTVYNNTEDSRETAKYYQTLAQIKLQ